MTGPAGGGTVETERRRVFDDAQREADTMFAQYQLSQLLASGDALEDLARAVLVEIARTSRAGGAALWLAEPGRVELELVAVSGPGDLDAAAEGDGAQAAEDGAHSIPPSFADAAEAGAWATAGGWSGVQLEESRDIGARGVERAAVGFVAVRPAPGVPLDPDHARYLALVRRELAITFRAAQLRSSLARDRAMLEAILEGASDAIVAVDADRRVVQLNVAAARLLGMPARKAIGAPCREVLDCGPFSVPGGPGAPYGVDDTPLWALRCGPVCPFGDVLESGRPMTAREQTMHHRDGTQVPVSASFAPTAGPAVGAVAVIRDLRPLRALDELKSSFVVAVSHELRTPLALIRLPRPAPSTST
jgi:PAS domain-containing protein